MVQLLVMGPRTVTIVQLTNVIYTQGQQLNILTAYDQQAYILLAVVAWARPYNDVVHSTRGGVGLNTRNLHIIHAVLTMCNECKCAVDLVPLGKPTLLRWRTWRGCASTCCRS